MHVPVQLLDLAPGALAGGIEAYLNPFRDERGVVTVVQMTGFNAGTSSPSAEDLREREARLRIAVEIGRLGTWDWNLQTGDVSWSDEHYRMQGYEVGAVTPSFEVWAAGVHPDDLDETLAALARARDLKTEYAHEFRTVRPTGEVRRHRARGLFFYDGDAPVRMIGVMDDVTGEHAAKAALAASEARLRALLEGIPQLVWSATTDGAWTWCSPQWTAYTGLEAHDSLGHGWLSAVHSEDRAAAGALSHAHENRVFAADYRIFNARAGRYAWFQTRATPQLDDGGAVVGWTGTSTDVDDLRRLQLVDRTLRAELQHRVRNTLAIVRSIVRRTAETSNSIEDYRQHLDGRLGAFARTQAYLTRDPGRGMDLRAIVGDELMAHLVNESERVTISGPAVRLPARAAEVIALAVHELVTNALKFGALGHADGGLRVAWSLLDTADGIPMLSFTWSEMIELAEPGEPRRRGFGIETLESSLIYDLDARCSFELTPRGLRYTATFPLVAA